uniref:Uncharacterized protein n=1 Tax=Steinernema glaseri TaxID=37863 RepID=A0A1I7ZVU9_9BILA
MRIDRETVRLSESTTTSPLPSPGTPADCSYAFCDTISSKVHSEQRRQTVFVSRCADYRTENGPSSGLETGTKGRPVLETDFENAFDVDNEGAS